jgi:hypothetical protein
MGRMIPFADFERALRRWKVRQAGGTPDPADESVATEVSAEAVVSSEDAAVSSEVYMETSAETRAVESLMPVVQFDRE